MTLELPAAELIKAGTAGQHFVRLELSTAVVEQRAELPAGDSDEDEQEDGACGEGGAE